MEPVEEALVRALEFACDGDLERARAALSQRAEAPAVRLDAYLAQQLNDSNQRLEAMKKARHDLGNALSVVQASIEAMLDGVVGITDGRLNRIREIISVVSASVYELTSEQDRRQD